VEVLAPTVVNVVDRRSFVALAASDVLPIPVPVSSFFVVISVAHSRSTCDLFSLSSLPPREVSRSGLTLHCFRLTNPCPLYLRRSLRSRSSCHSPADIPCATFRSSSFPVVSFLPHVNRVGFFPSARSFIIGRVRAGDVFFFSLNRSSAMRSVRVMRRSHPSLPLKANRSTYLSLQVYL